MTGLVSTIGRFISKRSSTQTVRQPIQETAWFANPDWCPTIAHLLSEGYCVVKNAVPSNIVDDAISAYGAFKQNTLLKHADNVDVGGFEAGKFRRVVNLHIAIPQMAQLFSRNNALPLLDSLFGSPTTLYTSLTFEIGSGQETHRDTPYFWTGPGYNYFGLWVALEPTDSENGALKVIPKSHLLKDPAERRRNFGNEERATKGTLQRESAFLWDRYQAAVNQQASDQGLNAIEVHVGKGDAIIWHPQLLHGGAAARDKDRSRLSLAMHVTPKNAVVFQQDIFFDPDAAVVPTGRFKYLAVDGRDILRHNEISIAHQVSIPADTAR